MTDFLYAIRRQTEIVPAGTLAANQSDTWYNYNAQGWLAAQGKTNSDGKSYRTRYKYLTDYPLSSTSATTANGVLYQAMKERFTLATEKISSTLVETISEVVTGPTDVRFAGATLHTFVPPVVVAGQATPSRPHQVRRWQPAGPLPLSSSYDSTRVISTPAGAELYVSPNFRVASTLLETTSRLVPLSTRSETGRQLTSVHLGYDNSLPVLQIANARASEVVFSDFESATSFGFMPSAGAVTEPAARTGKAGVGLTATTSLSVRLPSSPAPSYRLSFWARPAPGGTGSVGLSATISGGSVGTPPAQPVSLAAGSGWRLYEMTFNLTGIPQAARGGYMLRLTSDAAAQLDDVLFLPASAAAASTTYDVTKGKTSETDGQGRTMFYEYNALGDLARVRDHNGAIVKQVEKRVAGRVPEITPSFVVEGTPHDGLVLTFRANTACNSNLTYTWNFGDDPAIAQPGAVVTHPFNTGGRTQTFAITLSASIPGQSNKVYTSVQYVEIGPAPVSVTSCRNGVVSIDNCGIEPTVLENSCTPGATPQTGNNTYSVSLSTLGASNLVFTWYSRAASGAPWLATGQTGLSITVPVATTPSTNGEPAYQCIVTNSNGIELGASEVFGVRRYSSLVNGTNACPITY